MGTVRVFFLILSSMALLLMDASTAQMPGFVSLDCGGTDYFTDEVGLKWSPDNMSSGAIANISVPKENRKQYKTLRYFPADNKKYCYALSVTSRARYLIRATFLYGNFDRNNVYPNFDISFGATPWTTIVISDADTIEYRELIFLATDPTISICLFNAKTGLPFISTLELRQFNHSIYFNRFEEQFYRSLSARINFGSTSDAPVRYPDDPFDRIWRPDSLQKAHDLFDVDPGISKISTDMPIDVNRGDMPPQMVMQTAVVGLNGLLTYRLDLDGFPGYGWAFAYFAEIEDFGPTKARKFRLAIPGEPVLDKCVINIQENTRGKYRLYETGLDNVSIPSVLPLGFRKTSDSSLGPLLNALEIHKYLKKIDGSADGPLLAAVTKVYLSAEWAQEGGDPCLPVPWSWVRCSSDPRPRVTSINLSGKNLKGAIPVEFTKLEGLVELWLNNNSLNGSIPNFSECPSLKKIHLEDNHLTGKLPSSLETLPNLRELYVQNNLLSGKVPSGLLNKPLVLNYTGNADLHKGGDGPNRKSMIIESTMGVSLVLIASIAACLLMRKGKKTPGMRGQSERGLPAQELVSSRGDTAGEAAHYFTLSEIKDATMNFERRIGSGGFGVVYYGRLKDGTEIAVKMLNSDSFQGMREFSNEVCLLSRIHHRNLVQFLGYCQEDGKCILVYEFMHNGTLKEHLYDNLTHGRGIDWIQRLEIAEDAAKGIEYLHSGCVQAVIHRDLKTSNILLDKNMRAKVSDFGFSKLAGDGTSHVSSIVRGTVGYLDPEYYISQQLTAKSDVYSFGVILLELISGQQAISDERFGLNCRSIVQWAKLHIETGDIRRIIDPALKAYDIQSVWKIAEKALMCVHPYGIMRPSISEVVKEIQEIIRVERGTASVRQGSSMHSSAHPSRDFCSLDLCSREQYVCIDDSVELPTAR